MDFVLDEENEAFRNVVRDWVEKNYPKDAARDLEMQEFDYPFELWDKMSAAGFHAVGIDEQYGGAGGTVLTQVVLARELARSLAGLTWTWGISSFAGAKSVGLYGSEEQKQRFLPELAKGNLRFSIAVTEPSGGTDLLGAMKTTATRVDGGWRINGQKIWSTASHVADYLLLLARSDPKPEKKTQGKTLFLVPRTTDGVETRQIPKLGMRAVGSCEVYLEDVFVPDDLVLGEPGAAWYMMLGTLNNERIILSALCTGIIDGVLEDAVEYMNTRSAFGKKIGEFQALQHYVADMVMWQKQAELMTYHAAWLQSTGAPCGTESNMAKVITSEYANRAADLGIQILGGMGYAAETNAQRYWRDSRLFRIGPITSEMARNAIAESMGLPRSF
ncbi:acyl-CoA dehydrogenase family protein [Prauserella muralis]|uniref:Acyl-CoA dehydrogenase n=1 Tax=Prauserella muralis TaxID=588067 RepID=A0A2V4ADP1_9PSEU|nr:acyl-CoA dehydrogenase family protein [Prauserella muralis]PXY17430.1 acyl-CoA dehydrogenase [Prauserella muralis]TWE23600.1 alkylation response protein AidB-like acyl-CoA dehydrogenase [Prauserella muralis]